MNKQKAQQQNSWAFDQATDCGAISVISKSKYSISADLIRIKIPIGLSCPRRLWVLAKVPDDEATNDEESFCKISASTRASSTDPVKLSLSLLKKLTNVQSTLAGHGAGAR